TTSTPTNRASVSWDVVFSRSVTGVDASDFSLASSGLTGASITGVSGSGTTFTVTVDTGAGSGSLGLNLNDNDSIVDVVGNALAGSFSGQAFDLDRTLTPQITAAGKLYDGTTAATISSRT